MALNLGNVIEQVGKDKGIDKEILISALESAMLKAAEKRFGATKDIEAHFDEEAGEIELFVFKDVLEAGEIEDPDRQISLEEALELDPEAALGDSIGMKLDSDEFGRIDAQMAKQIIIQKVREAERDIVVSEYSDKQGEIVTGMVQRFERGDIIVDLGRAEGSIHKKEQVRREGYRQGERIRALILDVKCDNRGAQVLLSRSHAAFITKLFEGEVPEIYEGIVEIKAISREPGDRTKIAVFSNNHDVDPVGACVGIKGSRVQSVVQELKGEKIDIVHYSEDPAIFVKNTLAPAQISRVIMDEEEKSLEVIVPADQLSLAIGRKGQNVRLAAKLVGWKIDILTEEETVGTESAPISPEEALQRELAAHSVKEALEKADSVNNLKGVGPKTAEALIEGGYETIASVADGSVEELKEVSGIGDKTAERLFAAAVKHVEDEKKKKGEAEDED